MSDNSKIEWTDTTWNPVTGCDEVSPGCDRCYAKTFAERWRGTPGHHFENGFDVTLRPERLDQPLRWRKPRRVFVNSMSDLFHKAIPDEYIAKVFAVMAATPQHTYQLLTKRHGRMRSLLSDGPKYAWLVPRRESPFVQAVYREVQKLVPNGPLLRWPLPNLWLGVSVENQHWADIRIPALLDTPAAVRFLSLEPLLGPVDLDASWGRFAEAHAGAPGDYLHWAIVGGESGHGARPMHPQWARKLRDQCVNANIPFFFKQFGEWGLVAPTTPSGSYDFRRQHSLANDGTLYGPDELAYPDGPRYGEALRARHDRADLTAVYRVGKKAAGRLLDGREWNEFPASALSVSA